MSKRKINLDIKSKIKQAPKLKFKQNYLQSKWDRRKSQK